MRFPYFLTKTALLVALVSISLGCGRKNKYADGGAGGGGVDPVTPGKTPEVAKVDPAKIKEVVLDKKEPALGAEVKKAIAEEEKEPLPKKVVALAPPDWDGAKKNEWGVTEKHIISKEDAENYIPGTLRISPDGGRFAYGKKLADGEVMMLDGKEQVRLFKIDIKNIVFSPDSKHLIYTGYKLPNFPWEYTVVKNGDSWLVPSLNDANNGTRAVSSFLVNNDASEVSFYILYQYELGINKKTVPATVGNAAKKIRYAYVSGGQINVDGTNLKKFENSAEFQFSKEGDSHAFIVSQSGEQFVVFNQNEERAYKSISGLVLSPDGKRYAHYAVHDGKNYIIIDGKPKPLAGQTPRNVLFSPDSSRWATVIGNTVVVDHIADAEMGTPLPYSLAFSPDGKHLAYTVQVARGYKVVLDGKEHDEYTSIDGNLIFSPDGQSLVYLAQDAGKWWIILNGKKFAEVPHDPKGRWVLEFSPDSKSVGYAGSVDLAWHILLDGKLRESNEEIGPEGTRIGFGPDGSFTYFVKRRGAYYWVTEKRK